MRVYLAGPMTGIPEYNFPAFHAATADLRARGYDVWSPAESDAEHGGPEAAVADLPNTFRRDLDALLQLDALVLLPGWSRSQGALLERHAADVVGIPVYEYVPACTYLRRLEPLDWRSLVNPDPVSGRPTP